MCFLKDGSRRYRNLMPAIVAAQQRGSYRRALTAPTTRTVKTFRPTQQAQVLAAIFIAANARVELLQVPRIVFHAPEYYGLWPGESSGYPSLYIQGSVAPRKSGMELDEFLLETSENGIID